MNHPNKAKTIILGILILSAIFGFACDFEFEVESTTVAQGSEFYVRVLLGQTHNRCTLPSFDDDIHFEAEGFELIAKTKWRLIDRYTYELWLQVRAENIGEGWIKVFKTCSRNGYEEEVFPLTVIAGPER